MKKRSSRFRWLCFGGVMATITLLGMCLALAVNEARIAARRSADL